MDISGSASLGRKSLADISQSLLNLILSIIYEASRLLGAGGWGFGAHFDEFQLFLESTLLVVRLGLLGSLVFQEQHELFYVVAQYSHLVDDEDNEDDST